MNNIKKLRLEKGITQKTMSEILGVSQSAISFWESSNILPQANKLPQIAKILNCTIDEILR